MKKYTFKESFNLKLTKEEFVCLKDILFQFYDENEKIDKDKYKSFHHILSKVEFLSALFDVDEDNISIDESLK